MSTLSLRKIKHDSSAVDNITLDSNGNVGINKTTPRATTGFNSVTLNGTDGSEIWFDANNVAATRLSGTANETRITAQASGSVITMFTGATERVRVDNSGRVTMPYQPFFTVRQPANQTTTGGTGYYFYNYSDIIQNVGSHFNNSTGRFTAPITGVYLFRGIVMGVDSADQSPHCGFSINGNANTGGGSYSNNAMWEHPSNAGHKTDTMHIIKLNANDNIRLIQLNSIPVVQADRTYFMGYLLG